MATERTWAEVKAARLDLLEDEYATLREENKRLRKEIHELEAELSETPGSGSRKGRMQ